MARKLARVVTVDAVEGIPGADLIEVATVGGWKAVVKKHQFKPADLGVYFEIDTFLPDGNPAWQFLVEKSFRLFENRKGHVLKTLRLQKQLSQGLLLPLDVLEGTVLQGTRLAVGQDVSEALGVLKYEKPIPDCLLGIIRGYRSSLIPSTDQERVQNLAPELAKWQLVQGAWECTEKLEGESATFAWFEGELQVCSRQVSFLRSEEIPHWKLARQMHLQERFEALGERELAFQGELVGVGMEGNIYGYTQDAPHGFYLYDIYDIKAGGYLKAEERRALAQSLQIPHVPLIDPAFRLGPHTGMEALLQMADGLSALKKTQPREGLVFKSLDESASFKVISNKYLLKQKS